MKDILGWTGGGPVVAARASAIQVIVKYGNGYLEVAALDKHQRKLLAAFVETFADGFVDQENFERVWRQLAYSGRFDFKADQNGASAIKVMNTILEQDIGPPERRRQLAFNNIIEIYMKCIEQMQGGHKEHLLAKYNAFMEEGSRWMLESEASQSKYGTDLTKGLLLGKWKSELAITWEPATSVLTIAPPGSGKTQAQVIPALLTYEGSAVVLDVKGEIYEATAGRRQQMGQKIIRWNALDKSGTHRFNPLKAMSRDPDE
ncbi:MAG: type IV secretory system conjugative DNA transfer family protein, partial [Bacteroidota bacterium]